MLFRSLLAPAATSYLLGQAVAASYTCADGGSGLAACAGPVANGATINAAPVGAKTFTVNATDNVGNASSASVSYTVITVSYDFSGFFQPVDNPPTLNAVKAGAGVPVKFALGGNQGRGRRPIAARPLPPHESPAPADHRVRHPMTPAPA